MPDSDFGLRLGGKTSPPAAPLLTKERFIHLLVNHLS